MLRTAARGAVTGGSSGFDWMAYLAPYVTRARTEVHAVMRGKLQLESLALCKCARQDVGKAHLGNPQYECSEFARLSARLSATVTRH
jgi:hypothetical protein